MDNLLIVGLILAFFILYVVIGDITKIRKPLSINSSQTAFILALCIVATIYLYIHIFSLGPIAIIIAILSGSLLYLISYTILEDEKEH